MRRSAKDVRADLLARADELRAQGKTVLAKAEELAEALDEEALRLEIAASEGKPRAMA